MKLYEMIKDLPYLVDTRGSLDVEIEALSRSSNEPTVNGLFFCIVGARFDAHDYAWEAVSKGNIALIVERFLDDVDVPQVRVNNCRAAMARIAAAFNDYPARKLHMVGITGTKGKTTTTYLFKSICDHAGVKCGIIGSTGSLIGTRRMTSLLTTPDPIELQAMLKTMVDEGVSCVCMEVSAHAIDMFRLDGIVFDAGCFTNFSQDHLDYFYTMERYYETKKSFFTDGMVKAAVVNADDEKSSDLLASLAIPHLTYGIAAESDLFARNIEITENGVSFTLQLHDTEELEIDLRMTGMFNVYNALAAASCAMILGFSETYIKEGLEALTSVPGRIEMLQTNTPFKVILDYSHSPDALSNILRTVRQFTRGRIIALFGCGGDRDKGKRPIMGEIGGRMADHCILTSDNPRSEDPMVILRSIEKGIIPTHGSYEIIENRKEAIRHALCMARDGDVIVLAGKGHETYQEIKGIKRPFDEKVIVSELLHEMTNEEGNP